MSDSNLRWMLRNLPKKAEPAVDLWPGIASRIHPHERPHTAPLMTRWAVRWGLAAAVALLALGIGGSWRRDVVDPQAAMVRQQVAAMTDEYDAALAQMSRADVPPALANGLQALDAGAAQIRQALQREPRATYLIDQLQHTYTLRLQLTQRAVQG